MTMYYESERAPVSVVQVLEVGLIPLWTDAEHVERVPAGRENLLENTIWTMEFAGTEPLILKTRRYVTSGYNV